MSSSSARRRVALVLAAGLLAAGCSSSGEDADTEPTPSPPPSRVTELPTRDMEVPRIEFCGLVPDDVVERALDAPVEDGSGRATDLDVQETGCTWRGGGTVARAWIFSRPVTREQATAISSRMSTRDGCRFTITTAFGEPGLHQACRLGQGQARERWAGRIGDTWLTCELEGERSADLAAATERWCVELTDALDAA